MSTHTDELTARLNQLPRPVRFFREPHQCGVESVDPETGRAHPLDYVVSNFPADHAIMEAYVDALPAEEKIA